jgi:hypothetical protein
MKSLRRALASLFLLLAAAPALAQGTQSFITLYAPLPASKDQYSFADLYRLTVSSEWPLAAAPAAVAQAQEFQVRTVAGDAPVATQVQPYVFSIARVAQPQGLLLLVAGIAAALWVARRRLGYAIKG